ncbi:ABC transporter permease [Pseudokordiimonas caeni]|uniref:ABC transporter permease n=1 Tax=Pseudokordiimonas caeni TaxID=2997908 RepID=UPI0028123E3B|nr:ABC transporter permease [Pseudokordiimonas caeni]
MLANYLRSAIRNIAKERLYSAINIGGLAVGLMAAFLILLFVRFELSYDKEWANADRLYRMDTSFLTGPEPKARLRRLSGQLQAAMLSTFPEEIEAAARLRALEPTIRDGDKVTDELVQWADADLLKIFQFRVLKGDMKAAFGDKSSLAVSRTFAENHFGDADPLGRVLNLKVYNLDRDYRIVAVYEDLPRNSELDIPAVALMDEEAFAEPHWLLRNWGSTSVEQYVLLKSGASWSTIQAGMPGLLDKFVETRSGKGSSFLAMNGMKFSDYHAHFVTLDEMSVMAKMQILIAIAVVLVLVGAINFVNLATAQAIRRTREVALRKVLGAGRPQLIVQFLTESILITLIAAMLAVVLLEFSLPAFAEFLDAPLELSYDDGVFWASLIATVLVVGGLAGFYPAFAISGSRPGRILMANKSAESRGTIILRQVLVTFQFAVSVILIVSTIIIYGQTWFVTNMDPGYDRNNLLVVQGVDRGDMKDKRATLRDKVRKLSMVRAASMSSETPSDGNNSGGNFGPTPVRDEQINMGEIWIDDAFFDTYRIEMAAGRNFSGTNEADEFQDNTDENPVENRVMLNAFAAEQMGFASPDAAIGALVYNGTRPLRIVGVAKNARLQDINDPQRAEVYYFTRDRGYNLTVRFGGSPTEVVEAVRSVWMELAPFTPFVFTFVDDAVAEEFEEEVQMSRILTFFSGLAVLIASMGLYGLAAVSAERRTKEIGIRKVLGARVRDIVMMMVWQFSRPVIVANLIAWPVAFFTMSSWLEQYPNRIDSWLMLPACMAAGLAAFLIAWATVAGRAYLVARAKPINALRYE